MSQWIHLPHHLGLLIWKYADISPMYYGFKFRFDSPPIIDLELIPLPDQLAEIVCDYVITAEEVFAGCVLQSFYDGLRPYTLREDFPGLITEEIEDNLYEHGRACEYSRVALFKYNSWVVSLDFDWAGAEDDVMHAYWGMNDQRRDGGYNFSDKIHYSPMDIVKTYFTFTKKINKTEWADKHLKKLSSIMRLFPDNEEMMEYIEHCRN